MIEDICISRDYQTHFLHLSHALLTLVLSLSSLRRFAGGDCCPLDSAFEGVVAEVAGPSVRSSLRLAGTHDEGLTPASEGTCGGLIQSIPNGYKSIGDARGGYTESESEMLGEAGKANMCTDVLVAVR